MIDIFKLVFEWAKSVFSSPGRVQAFQLAEEAYSATKNLMEALKEAQDEQIRLWEELKDYRLKTDAQIRELEEAERRCKMQTDELVRKLQALEGKLET